MNQKQIQEQIQEDIMTHFSDDLPDNVITKLCQIVCDNFRKLDE